MGCEAESSFLPSEYCTLRGRKLNIFKSKSLWEFEFRVLRTRFASSEKICVWSRGSLGSPSLRDLSCFRRKTARGTEIGVCWGNRPTLCPPPPAPSHWAWVLTLATAPLPRPLALPRQAHLLTFLNCLTGYVAACTAATDNVMTVDSNECSLKSTWAAR